MQQAITIILNEGNSLYTGFRQPLAMHTHKLRHYFDTVIIINTAWRYTCTQIIALRKWKEFSTVSPVMHSSDTITFIPFSIWILMIVAFAAWPLPLCLPSWSCTLSSIPVIYSELYHSWMLKPLVGTSKLSSLMDKQSSKFSQLVSVTLSNATCMYKIIIVRGTKEKILIHMISFTHYLSESFHWPRLS